MTVGHLPGSVTALTRNMLPKLHSNVEVWSITQNPAKMSLWLLGLYLGDGPGYEVHTVQTPVSMETCCDPPSPTLHANIPLKPNFLGAHILEDSCQKKPQKTVWAGSKVISSAVRTRRSAQTALPAALWLPACAKCAITPSRQRGVYGERS